MVTKQTLDEVREDYILINKMFFYALWVFILIVFYILLLISGYFLGKRDGHAEGYTQGYDNCTNIVKMEIANAYETTKCGDYITLYGYDKTYYLYKKCENYSYFTAMTPEDWEKFKSSMNITPSHFLYTTELK